MVRAICGCLFEQIHKPEQAHSLRTTLNPLTTFNINISESILPNKKSWGIV
jgi:hypothetical protein